MSARPNFCCTAFAIAATESGLDTSQTTASALRPAASTSLTVSPPSAMSATATCTPSSARRFAKACPMPLAPPVMTATLSLWPFPTRDPPSIALDGERASSRLQLPRLAQIRIDPRLPARTGLAIGGEHIGVEAEFHGLLRVWQRRPAAADNPVAVPDFSSVKKCIRQLRRVIGINPCGGARFLLPWH